MSRAKLGKSEIFKISQFLLVLILIGGWLFSGWPQIWQKPLIPSKIQENSLFTGLLLTAIFAFVILVIVNLPRSKILVFRRGFYFGKKLYEQQ